MTEDNTMKPGEEPHISQVIKVLNTERNVYADVMKNKTVTVLKNVSETIKNKEGIAPVIKLGEELSKTDTNYQDLKDPFGTINKPKIVVKPFNNGQPVVEGMTPDLEFSPLNMPPTAVYIVRAIDRINKKWIEIDNGPFAKTIQLLFKPISRPYFLEGEYSIFILAGDPARNIEICHESIQKVIVRKGPNPNPAPGPNPAPKPLPGPRPSPQPKPSAIIHIELMPSNYTPGMRINGDTGDRSVDLREGQVRFIKVTNIGGVGTKVGFETGFNAKVLSVSPEKRDEIKPGEAEHIIISLNEKNKRRPSTTTLVVKGIRAKKEIVHVKYTFNIS